MAIEVIGKACALQNTPIIPSAATFSNGKLNNPAMLLPNVAPVKNTGLPRPPWNTDPNATAVNTIFQKKANGDAGVSKEELINFWPRPL